MSAPARHGTCLSRQIMQNPLASDPSDLATSATILPVSAEFGDPPILSQSRRARTLRVAVPVLAGVSAAAAIVAATRLPRPHQRAIALTALGTAVGVGLVRWQLGRLFVEQPAHTVKGRIGALEIRTYPATVQAVTLVEGVFWRRALDEGFRRLGAFIFGSNSAGEHIAMTSPVIATAAVAETTAIASTEGSTTDGAAGLNVAFIMPEARSSGSLPVPRDHRVRFRDVPPRRVAVLRFTGRYEGTNVALHQRKLLDLVERAGLTARGEPTFAGYDGPSTIPILRRLEVWVEID
ncbi:SOUL heme-binding protein [Chondromyces apiculatus DSM 436]|uniref:SOUL heme-binding protein n=1 Tax=Chondromyces apiculatus DSM 436 TaxID=1192034 RepID=A0A017TE54_9BACT|nr:SOUL heme-binding protein [Chondromyces apiculatus DSM 436]